MLELPPLKRHGLLTDAVKLSLVPRPDGILGLSKPHSYFQLSCSWLGNVHLWH